MPVPLSCIEFVTVTDSVSPQSEKRQPRVHSVVIGPTSYYSLARILIVHQHAWDVSMAIRITRRISNFNIVLIDMVRFHTVYHLPLNPGYR